jgi:hypothetical protein
MRERDSRGLDAVVAQHLVSIALLENAVPARIEAQ